MNNEEIHRLCSEYIICDYTINEDLTIDVHSDIFMKIDVNEIEKFPLKFHKIIGDFYLITNGLEAMSVLPEDYVGSLSIYDSEYIFFEDLPEYKSYIRDKKLNKLLK